MASYILVLFFHVGMFGHTDSNATTTIPGFSTKAECDSAGKDSARLVSGTKKELVFVCVKQTK